MLVIHSLSGGYPTGMTDLTYLDTTQCNAVLQFKMQFESAKYTLRQFKNLPEIILTSESRHDNSTDCTPVKTQE